MPCDSESSSISKLWNNSEKEDILVHDARENLKYTVASRTVYVKKKNGYFIPCLSFILIFKS